MKNIYGKTNRYKTKESRYYLLGLYRNRLLKLLQEGYSPFQDNTDHHIKKRHKDKETALIGDRPIAPESKKETVSFEKKEIQQDDERQLSVREAIDYALELKVNVAGARTLVDYKSRCDLFVKWISENLKEIKLINEVDKKVVSSFLNYVQLKNSPRNRNNYRTCFSSLFQVLEDNGFIRIY